MVYNPKTICAKCNIKLNITNRVDCDCGKILCYKHRYYTEHSCTFDYKEKYRKKLEINNQKLISNKIIMI